MIAGVAGGFGLLWLIGWGAARLAGRLRTGLAGPLRIGLANLAGPGSAARTAAPAIGLGVALLAAVVLIQSSLLAQVHRGGAAHRPGAGVHRYPRRSGRRLRRGRRRAPSAGR